MVDQVLNDTDLAVDETDHSQNPISFNEAFRLVSVNQQQFTSEEQALLNDIIEKKRNKRLEEEANRILEKERREAEEKPIREFTNYLLQMSTDDFVEAVCWDMPDVVESYYQMLARTELIKEERERTRRIANGEVIEEPLVEVAPIKIEEEPLGELLRKVFIRAWEIIRSPWIKPLDISTDKA